MSKEQISTYVEEDEKQEIRVLAAKRGLSISEWLRRVAMEELEKEREEGNSMKKAAAPTAD